MDSKIILDIIDYDGIIFGTGLLESLLASSLAKAGQKILILDIDKSYSGSLQTLTLKEFLLYFNINPSDMTKISENDPEEKVQTLVKNCVFQDFTIENNNLPLNSYKLFNIDIQPRLLFSTSKSVDLMKKADLDRYMEFSAFKNYSLFLEDFLLNPPLSKGEIFKSSYLSPLEKRYFFKFLMNLVNLFAPKEIDPNSTKEFEKQINLDPNFIEKYKENTLKDCRKMLSEANLSQKLQSLIIYSLAYYDDNIEKNELNTEELCKKLLKFVRSLGVHSEMPFLYPNYGIGDIPQAFARIAAVFGSIFIINKSIKITNIKKNNNEWEIYSDISGERGYLKSKWVIFGNEYKESLYNIIEDIHLKSLISKQNLLINEVLINRTILITKKNEESKINLPSIYKIPPMTKNLNNENPITIFLFDNKTSSTPIDYILISAQSKQNKEITNFGKTLELFLKTEVPDLITGECSIINYNQKIKENDDYIWYDNLFIARDIDFSLDLDYIFNDFEKCLKSIDIIKGEPFEETKNEIEVEEKEGGELDKLVLNLDKIINKNLE